MKMKLVLAACIASLALAACNVQSPTATRTLDPAASRQGGPGTFGSNGLTGPRTDGVGTYGSGGFSDTTKAPPR